MSMVTNGLSLPIIYWKDEVINNSTECVLYVKNYDNSDLKYYIILGQPFTDTHYIALDLDNQQMGFVYNQTYPSSNVLNQNAPAPSPPNPGPNPGPHPPSDDTYAISFPINYNEQS